MEKDQGLLFDNIEDFDIIEREWEGMPEYAQEDLGAYRKIYINLRNQEDVDRLSKLMDQKIYPNEKSYWFPHKADKIQADKIYTDEKESKDPKYPIYIISKGRWESRLTSKALEKMSVPYKIVIESQEYDQYSSVIDPKKILVLPFSNLGQGSIPARNWVWEHSIKLGAEKHWIMDDNIHSFKRRNNNLCITIGSQTMFRITEDFVDRYENVALSGFHYVGFAPNISLRPPFRLNSRVYSCTLIKNDINYRWRGKFNEDTDLSLRVLKDGWCTMLFYMFLQEKATTMTMKGGNTEEVYGDTDNRYEFAKSLYDQHPDVVKITKKFGRWHHHVDYKIFRKNKLIRKPDVKIEKGVNNYGLVLKYINREKPNE